MASKIRKNDEVVVIAGKHKGQVGKVLKLDLGASKVWVDKLNIVKRHQKPTQNNSTGGIIEKESAIHISNVALKIKGKEAKPTKIGFRIDEKGKKIRVARKTKKDY